MGILGNTKIQVLNDQTVLSIEARHLKVGYYILGGMYMARVYFVNKCKKTKLFYRFTLESGRDVSVTKKHIMLANYTKIRADQLSVGDSLQIWNGHYEKIAKIDLVVGNPVYILTDKGNFTVNGIKLSCYTDPESLAKYGTKPINFASKVHPILAHQWFYAVPRKVALKFL